MTTPRSNRGTSTIDRQLEAWAEWYVWYLPFVGFGGGIDRGDISELGVRIQAGSGYSNPVLTEVMRQVRAHHGQQARLHNEICALPAPLRLVLILRYCGKRESVFTVAEGLRAADGGNVMRKAPWSGPLAWKDAAAILKISEDTAAARLKQVKRILSEGVSAVERVRAGKAGD